MNLPAHPHGNVERAKHDGEDQKQGSANEREMLKKQITSNKMIVFGLLFVASILMIALGYMVIQNRKLATLDTPACAMPPVIPGTGPPGAPMYEPPSTELPPMTAGGSNARAAAQNDKLLRQKQHRAPVQNRQSALARHRQGHSDQEDRHRLETIIEGSESQVDDVAARTREYVARQLQEDAAADARDEPLGTGSFELQDAELNVRDSQTCGPAVEECRDEALIDQNNDADDDADDDQPPAKIVAMCSVVLASGSRSGQECNRECAPGKTMCKSHLGVSARKK